ncbi:hypothetical protein GTY89_38775 [Streptomyces sp. SID5471]|nr:hypothetical protein [Streptomyces sp. SID5471]QTL91058.1 hypothetical protein FMM49_39945 [Streptomyces rimosus subsp. rimosus]
MFTHFTPVTAHASVSAGTVRPTRPAAPGSTWSATGPSPTKTRWADHGAPASLPAAVRKNEEVVPVNAVSTWVLPSGVTVGR